MSGLRALLLCVAMLLPALASGVEHVKVCYNYGCLAEAEVVFNERQLEEIRQMLVTAPDALHERAMLGMSIGYLLGWAGQQSPISADKGGNLADDGVYGRMDCIDHSTTTTRLLRLLEGRGWLKFHRVLEPALRTRLLFFQHFSARIEEMTVPGENADSAQRFAVDSWFFDNGRPAVVMPLTEWFAGESPNVDE
ncbi:hypothetical protein [Propionivibrio limicola]|uniref:hypothetical protein n=1 Tax=Propionivibrio limicola TaxID=167645 RepID=UPI001292B071|nr:hypothetical protein [Propionivibrio limicola]